MRIILGVEEMAQWIKFLLHRGLEFGFLEPT